MAAQQSAATRGAPGRWLGRLGVATTIGMLIVVAMGDLVTNAGAANGCGRSWPLCHGQFVPTFTPQTLIEFGHRMVVGFVSIGVVALAVGLLWRMPRRLESRVLAPALVVFLLLQAVLGGMAVLWPQSPPILALHMGISLLAFATVLLATALVLERGAADRLRDRPVPRRFGRLVWLTLAYLYLLVYLGAFVRHSSADLACAGWPTCNGALLPPLDGLAAINFVHRVAALGGALLYLALFLTARPLRRDRPDLYFGSLAAFGALLAQAASGALVATLGMPLWTALLHGALVTLVFGATSYLGLHVLPRPAAARDQSEAAPVGARRARQVAAVTPGTAR